MDKEIIGKLNYEWSFDYYNQFIAIIKQSKLLWVASWIPTLWVTVIGILLIIGGSHFYGICFCVCAVYFIWNEFNGNSPKAIYKSYKKLQELKVEITLNYDEIIQRSKYGVENLPYNLLYGIKSSKYGYVLLDSKCSGYYLPKAECSNEVISFIEELKNKSNK